MQHCGEEAMQCPGPDDLGQNKKEQQEQNDSKMWRKDSRCPRLDQPGQNKQHELPPPGLDHPGTAHSLTPRVG